MLIFSLRKRNNHQLDSVYRRTFFFAVCVCSFTLSPSLSSVVCISGSRNSKFLRFLRYTSKSVPKEIKTGSTQPHRNEITFINVGQSQQKIVNLSVPPFGSDSFSVFVLVRADSFASAQIN